MAAPANDDLTNAQLLVGSVGTVEGTTFDATADAGHYDPVCDAALGAGAANSVWYKLAVPAGWDDESSVLGIRLAQHFVGSGEGQVVEIVGFTTFPPATGADVEWLNSGYPVVGDNLIKYNGVAPVDGFFYVGVGAQDPGGEDTFSLDWSVEETPGVAVAFDDKTLAPAPYWTDISRFTNRIDIARGRTSELDKTGTGTASVSTIDLDGSLDPTNGTGRYADNLDPMKQARITIVNPWRLLNEADSTVYSLFRGYVDTWGEFEVSQDGRRIEGQLQLVDALDLFAELRMMPGQGDTPPSGAEGDAYLFGGPNGYSRGGDKHVDQRIVDILDLIGWGPPGEARVGLRDVFSGNVTVLEQVYARADQALTAIDDAVDAEFPFVANRFITKDGVFAFRGRFARFFPDNPGYGIGHWYLGGRTQAEADPENVVVISRLPGFRRSANDVINAAIAWPSAPGDADPTLNLITDSTSISKYGYRSRDTENLLTYKGHNDDLSETDAVEETRKFAEYRVGNYKTPETRVSQIEIVARDPRDPLAKAQWDFLTQVELSDLITLTTTHPGGGGFDDDFYIEGIRYVIEIAPPPKLYQITCTLDVSPRRYYDYNPFGSVDTGVS